MSNDSENDSDISEASVRTNLILKIKKSKLSRVAYFEHLLQREDTEKDIVPKEAAKATTNNDSEDGDDEENYSKLINDSSEDSSFNIVYGSINHKRKGKTNGNSSKMKKQNKSTKVLTKSAKKKSKKNVTQKTSTRGRKRKGRIIKNSRGDKNSRMNITRKNLISEDERLVMNRDVEEILQDVRSMEQIHVADNFVNTIIKEEPEYDQYSEQQSVIENQNSIFDDDIDIKEDEISLPDEEVERQSPRVLLERLILSDNLNRQTNVNITSSSLAALPTTNVSADNRNNVNYESRNATAFDKSKGLVSNVKSLKDTADFSDIRNIKITRNINSEIITCVSVPIKTNISNQTNQLYNKNYGQVVVERFQNLFSTKTKQKHSWNIPTDLRKGSLHIINSKDKIFPNALLEETNSVISDETVDAGVSKNDSKLNLTRTFTNNYANDNKTLDNETKKNINKVLPTSDSKSNKQVVLIKRSTISFENSSATLVTSDKSDLDNINIERSSDHGDSQLSETSSASSPKKDLEKSDTVNSPKRMPQFKMPLLPPAKRPPARTKLHKETQSRQTTLSDSLLSNNSDTSHSRVNSENEDTISLGISSLLSMDFDENLSVDGESSVKKNTPSPPQTDELASTQLEPKTSLLYAENQKRVMEWISDVVPEVTNKKPAFPPIFKTLCLNHFSKGCYYSRCFRKHIIPYQIKREIQQMPYDQLMKVYEFTTQKRHKLYEALFTCFAEAFVKLKCTIELLNCVNDILRIVCNNKTPFIETTVNCLLHLDIPFNQIIDEIVNSNKTTIDILLEIIFLHHKQVLCNDWYIVQNLLKYKRDHSPTEFTPVDHGLVEEIMIACCNDKNVKLARDIVKDIIEPEQPPLVDLQLISSSTLNNMLSILNIETCNEKRTLIDKMKRLNITIVSLMVTDRENSSITDTMNPMQYNRENSSITDTIDQMQYSANQSQPEPITANSSNIAKNTSAVNYSNSRSQLDTSNKSFTTDSQKPYDEEFERCWNEGTPSRELGSSQSKTPNSSGSFSNTSSEYYRNSEVGFDNPIDYQNNSYKDDQSHPYPQDSTLSPEILPTLNHSCVSSEAGAPNVRFYNSQRHSFVEESPVMVEDLNRDFENMTEYEPEMLHGRLSGLSQNSEITDFINWQPQVEVLQKGEQLTEADMTALKNAIDNGSRCDFLKQFLTFKDSPCMRAFVLNTLVFFKSKTAKDIYEMIYQLICGFERFDPNFTRDEENIKNVLEMLCINVIAMLENYKAYENGGMILLKFQHDLKSLVNTTWFSGPHRHEYSEAGKYIYFSKIFVKGGFFKEAWKIISAPELRLLYGSDTWSIQNRGIFDKKFKNFVLRDLLDMSLETDIKFASCILLHMLDSNNISTDIDLWRYFNTMLVKMLHNKEAYKEDLTQLVKRVTNGWYKILSASVMRGLFICLAVELADNKIEFYDTCCMKNIYQALKGDEKILLLKTDMTEEEIYMTLHVYLAKKIKNNFSLTDVNLILREPSQLIEYHPNTLLSPKIGFHDLRLRALRVLSGSFCSIIHVEYKSDDHKIINIRKQYLRYVYEDYRKQLSEF